MSRVESEAYKAWYKAYYAANKDKYLERAKNQREADPEARKAYNKAYYQANRDKIQEYNRTKKREYYAMNKEHILKRDAESKKKREAKKTPAPTIDQRKLPKDYEPTPETIPFGFPQEHHKRKKLLEIAPQGWLPPKESSNPFLLTFS